MKGTGIGLSLKNKTNVKGIDVLISKTETIKRVLGNMTFSLSGHIIFLLFQKVIFLCKYGQRKFKKKKYFESSGAQGSVYNFQR